MTSGSVGFNLSTVFDTVAKAVPDNEALVWRDHRFTYGQLNDRINRVANYLIGCGLGRVIPRSELGNHESGQDHLGLYLRNGNEYIEGWLGGFRARLASFNVNYRYVEEELVQLLADADAKVLIFHAEFADRVDAIRAHLPQLQVLIQVADDSGNPLLEGAVDYESVLAETSADLPDTEPAGDDLFLLYTGGTTGMPKGVLWTQNDVYLGAAGGRVFETNVAFTSYEEVARYASRSYGGLRVMFVPPLMHGAAQWGVFHVFTSGGTVVLPGTVDRLDPVDILTVIAREQVVSAPLVGDAMARPLIEEIERGDYDLSHFFAITNGGATMTTAIKERWLAALPHLLVIDAVGASETGTQMKSRVGVGDRIVAGVFDPGPDTVVLDEGRSRVLGPGEYDVGWLAQRGDVPLGYLGDPDTTRETFPVISGVRYSVPGDRARRLPSGQTELLGRDAATINSGGEKVFGEEVERAVAAHPGVNDVIVVGRTSEQWGSEVVALVQLAAGVTLSDQDLVDECSKHIADYKIPKVFVRVPDLVRSPAGKADYRWAREQAEKAQRP